MLRLSPLYVYLYDVLDSIRINSPHCPTVLCSFPAPFGLISSDFRRFRLSPAPYIHPRPLPPGITCQRGFFLLARRNCVCVPFIVMSTLNQLSLLDSKGVRRALLRMQGPLLDPVYSLWLEQFQTLRRCENKYICAVSLAFITGPDACCHLPVIGRGFDHVTCGFQPVFTTYRIHSKYASLGSPSP